MYIQVENPRTNVEAVPNRKKQTENDNSHWYFVRQKLLMFKNGESHPDKANLMLTIAQSQKEADDVIPFKEGFYVLDDDAFHQVSSGANREPELACNFTKLRLMTDKELEFFGLSDKSKPANDPLKKFSPNATA